MTAHHSSSSHRQRGAATLFIILMLGLAVSVTVATTVYSLRGTQAQQLTDHSATTAQAAAWRGVEALRQYFLNVDAKVWPTWAGATNQPVTGMQSLGVSSAVVTSITKINADNYQVDARVTGQAGTGNDLSTSTVEVVYTIVPGMGTPGAPAVCHALPTAPMVFNGDLSYSGGQLDADQGTKQAWDYKNIVVAGKLTVAGGSTAMISGCVKGDADISGGGLTDNGHIYSEGTIALHGMAFPANTALWGRAVWFDGGSGGPPNMTWAGAWQTNILNSSNQVIGTAVVGGKLLASSIPANAPLPWTSGTLVPAAGGAEAGFVLVTLNDNSTQFLLNLNQLTISPTTGAATGATAAAQQIAGTAGANLPDSISFAATGVATTDNALVAGSISMSSAASLSISGTTWGQDISILNWSQSFPTLWANGNLRITGNDTKINSLIGGGNFFAMNGSCAFPTIATSGVLAGTLQCGNGGTLPTTAPANLQTSVANTSPGLPGVPYCDARVSPVDTDSFKSTANYVFQNVGGSAQLTIQNVTSTNGTNINGVYPFASLTAAQKQTLAALMTCNNGNDAGCLKILNSNGSWTLNAASQFPPGVVWFDNALTIAGSTIPLTNTIINKGGPITLTDNGGALTVQAPNIAGAAATCGGAVYPSNLCTSPTALATWTDETGTTHTGLPVGNLAIITDNALTAAGWTLKGSVVLGGTMNTSGAAVSIQGSLTVGSNQPSSTTISAGGIHVSTPYGGDNSQLPICNGAVQPTLTPTSAAVQWSRYL